MQTQFICERSTCLCAGSTEECDCSSLIEVHSRRAVCLDCLERLVEIDFETGDVVSSSLTSGTLF